MIPINTDKDAKYPLSDVIIGYDPDKPRRCGICYFWNDYKKRCIRETCYYAVFEDHVRIYGKTEKKMIEKNGNCHGCPYGRVGRCIGYCIVKYQMERRRRQNECC